MNAGMMLRSACAMGCKEILVVGDEKKMQLFGAHGTEKHVTFRFFKKLKDAVEFCHDNEVFVCGVEIRDDACSVDDAVKDEGWHLYNNRLIQASSSSQDRKNITESKSRSSSHLISHKQSRKPFRGHTAVVLGNEGVGILPEHAAHCDYFVYIPQFGDGTASLNVSVAFSIIAHRFASWAGFQESSRAGEKYIVKPPPQKSGPTTEEDFEKRRQRAEKRAFLQMEKGGNQTEQSVSEE